MRRVQRTRLLIWAAVALVYATGLEVQFACGGPAGATTIFHVELSPSPHYAEFAAGNLGILDQRFLESQFVVAYRYLTERPLSPAEQETVREYWRQGPPDYTGRNGATEAWQRTTTPGKRYFPSLSVHRYLRESGLYILNCNESAFRTAVARYRFYRATYGKGAPSTVRWLDAQREVFSNCDREGTIPAEPDGTFDAVQRADREYQIAAAHFYRTDYDEAHARFLRISEDEDSDWQGWGVYLAARAMLRKGTVEEDEDALKSALRHLQSVLESPESIDLHESTEGLMRLTERRLGSSQGVALANAAEALQRRLPGEDVESTFWDYALMLDEEKPKDVERLDPMSAWIVGFRRGFGPAHADRPPADLEGPELLLALHRAQPKDPNTEALIEAGLAVARDYPGYDTARFHAARLLIAQGRLDEARQALTEAMEDRGDSLSLSTRNRLAALRLRTAGTMDEFFADAIQSPLGLAGQEVARDLLNPSLNASFREDRLLADASLGFVHRLAPVEVLADGAGRESLPQTVRRALGAAAWTRTVMLGRRDSFERLSRELEELAPEAAERLRRIRRASDEDWRSEAVLLMLDQPGWSPLVRPGVHQAEPLDESHGSFWNWWSSGGVYATPRAYRPELLTEAQRQAGAAEFDALRAVGSAATFLGDYAVAWAEAHPDDPRVPRALHRVVYLTRHCCTSEDKGEVSKAAFDLLHRRYPESEWAEKTPYWFR